MSGDLPSAQGLGHGDDFLLLGDDEDIAAMDELLKKKYEVTRTGVLGPEPGDDKVLNFLNRKLRYVDEQPARWHTPSE